MQCLADLFKEIFLAIIQKVFADHKRDRVDAGKAVFERQRALFQNIEHQRAESRAVTDHDLFNLDHGHSLAAGDAGHGVFDNAGRKVANDHGAGVFRTVRVADVDRDLEF